MANEEISAVTHPRQLHGCTKQLKNFSGALGSGRKFQSMGSPLFLLFSSRLSYVARNIALYQCLMESYSNQHFTTSSDVISLGKIRIYGGTSNSRFQIARIIGMKKLRANVRTAHLLFSIVSQPSVKTHSYQQKNIFISKNKYAGNFTGCVAQYIAPSSSLLSTNLINYIHSSLYMIIINLLQAADATAQAQRVTEEHWKDHRVDILLLYHKSSFRLQVYS